MKRIINNFLGGNIPNNKLNLILISLFLTFVLIVGLITTIIIQNLSLPKHITEHKTHTVKSGEKITLNDNSLGEIWLNAIEGIDKNTYNKDGFTSDSTFKYYNENGKAASYEGIDVSTFQGDIDWKRVKSAGIDFAIIRIGGRGYTNGDIYEDDRFKENIEGAKGAGIKVGAYFFSQAITVDEAKEEAEYVINKLKDYKLDYPVAFDWEIIGNAKARTDSVTPEILTKSAKAFCDMIEEAGFIPMIYVSQRLGYYKYDLSQLADIDLWYVDYDNYTPGFYYNFTIWQYSESATIDGINGEIDLNISFKEY